MILTPREDSVGEILLLPFVTPAVEVLHSLPTALTVLAAVVLAY